MAQSAYVPPTLDDLENQRELNQPLLQRAEGPEDKAQQPTENVTETPAPTTQTPTSPSPTAVPASVTPDVGDASAGVVLPQGYQMSDPMKLWREQKRQMELWLLVAVLEFVVLFPFILSPLALLILPPVCLGGAAASRYLSTYHSTATQARNVKLVMSLAMGASLSNLLPLAISVLFFLVSTVMCPAEGGAGCIPGILYMFAASFVTGWYTWLSFVISSNARTVSIMMDPVSSGLVRLA